MKKVKTVTITANLPPDKKAKFERILIKALNKVPLKTWKKLADDIEKGKLPCF